MSLCLSEAFIQEKQKMTLLISFFVRNESQQWNISGKFLLLIIFEIYGFFFYLWYDFFHLYMILHNLSWLLFKIYCLISLPDVAKILIYSIIDALLGIYGINL